MDHWKGITVESGRGKRPGFEGFVCLCASLAIQWNVSPQDFVRYHMTAFMHKVIG